MSEERKQISVDAGALREVLQALDGPPHYMRELQFTRGGAANGLLDDNPIDLLITQYNEWAAVLNASQKPSDY